MWGVVFKKGKWDTYCLRVIEERLLWSYYMIFDSCQTRNVIMYDTLSEGKKRNSSSTRTIFSLETVKNIR